MRLLLATLALLMSCPSIASADTWVIRADGTGDAPTIQAGIDSAAVGDTVALASGTYTGSGNRDIDFLGKAITVSSQSGDPDACIIDCEGTDAEPHRGFYFHTNEGQSSILSGVTVTNGNEHSGGGVLCSSSSPRIQLCRIVENTAFLGGGLYCEGSSLTLLECIFWRNSAYQGAGANCEDVSSAAFTGCVFSENVATTLGGAVLCGMNSTVTLTRCTLVANGAGGGGAGVDLELSGASLDNTIIAFSSAGDAIQCGSLSGATLACCDIYGNTGGDWVGCIAGRAGTNGNFSADPQFCGVQGSTNYFLQSDSPCNAGNHPDGEPCGLIGAFPQGCGTVSTETRTWGAIKSIYK
jgi:predicted outer membrane repeat protein